MISGLVQPDRSLRTSAHTTPNAPTVTSSIPPTSKRALVLSDSVNLSRAATTNARPSGTLIQKIHGHEIPCTTAPPTNGPSGTETPVVAANTPRAPARRSGGKAAVRKASASGMIAAEPAPWTARAAISVVGSPAKAHHAEAAAKRSPPIVKTRRRPNLSPNADAGIRSTANTRV
jgi:hypothetical protein